MGLLVCVYLFHQFLGVVLGCGRNLRLHLLFFVLALALMCVPSMNTALGGKVSRLRHFLQDPTKDLVYRLLGKPVPEVIAHCGKMGRFIL